MSIIATIYSVQNTKFNFIKKGVRHENQNNAVLRAS